VSTKKKIVGGVIGILATTAALAIVVFLTASSLSDKNARITQLAGENAAISQDLAFARGEIPALKSDAVAREARIQDLEFKNEELRLQNQEFEKTMAVLEGDLRFEEWIRETERSLLEDRLVQATAAGNEKNAPVTIDHRTAWELDQVFRWRMMDTENTVRLIVAWAMTNYDFKVSCSPEQFVRAAENTYEPPLPRLFVDEATGETFSAMKFRVGLYDQYSIFPRERGHLVITIDPRACQQ